MIFGTAAWWARLPGWREILGVALPAAVPWAEAGMVVHRGRHGDLGVATLLAGMGGH